MVYINSSGTSAKPFRSSKRNSFKTAFLAAIMGLFCVSLCYIVLSVSCILVVTCWEMLNFLDIQYVMFSCVL